MTTPLSMLSTAQNQALVLKLAALLLLVVAIWAPSVSIANCTSCTSTVTVSGTNTSTVNISTQDAVICLIGSGVFSGTIEGNNRRGSICIGPGVTLSSSAVIRNFTNGPNVTNHGTFQANSFVLENNRTLINNGTLTGTFFLNGGNITNSGTASFTSMTVNSGSITSSGSISFGNSITSNSFNFSATGPVNFLNGWTVNSGSYVFDGVLNVTGGLTVGNGVSITTNSTLNINGDLNLQNGSSIYFASQINLSGNLVNDGLLRADGIPSECASLCPPTNKQFTNRGQISTTSGKLLLLCRNPGGNINQGVTILAEPTASGTSLVLNQAGNAVTGSFTAASPLPGGYVVLRKISPFTSADEPVFGRTYTVGSMIGAATVVSILSSTATTFTDNFTSCELVYYQIYSVTNATASCAAYRRASPAANTLIQYSVGGSASGGRTICWGDAAPAFSVTGHVGAVQKWQSASDEAFSQNVSDIASTSTTYTPPVHPSGTTFYRAVIQSGVCASASSTPSQLVIKVDPQNTTWLGTSDRLVATCSNWNEGRPVTSTNVVINGASFSPRLAANLTINNLTFGSVNPTTAAIDLNGFTLQVNGDLTIATGSTLNINNGKLLVYGNVTGGGTLSGGTTADLELSGNGNQTLAFASGAAQVRNFSITKSSGNIILNSALTVSGAFVHNANSTLQLGAHVLTLNGACTFNGNITGNASADLIIGGSGAISTAFSPSVTQQVSNLEMNRTGATLTLGTSLTVSGTLTLTAGTLAVGAGNTLIINGAVQRTSGEISVTPTSNLTFGGSGAVPAAGILFSTTANTLNNLEVNRTGASVVLGSSLTVAGTLRLVAGNVGLASGRVLTVTGDANISGSSTINGNATATLNIQGSGNLATALRFNASSLGNLNISRSNATVALGTNLTVGIALTTTNNSVLNLNGRILTGAYTGSQSYTLAGTTGSTLNITAASTSTVRFATGAQTLGTVSMTGTNARLVLATALGINTTYSATNGSAINLNGNHLTLAGSVSGALLGSSTSSLTLNGGVTAASLSFVSGAQQLNNLTINRGAAQVVTVTSDLSVRNLLQLTSGIVETSASTITIESTGSIAGETDDTYVRGRLATSRNVAQGVAESFGNLGVTILANGTAPGNTLVVRNTATTPTGNGRAGLRNVVSITPTINSGLNATLTMRYLTNTWVLNSNQSNTLLFWRSTDGGSTWQRRNFTARSTTDKTVTLSGINAFSDWALSDGNNPLPVSLTGFWGKVEGEQVKLNWATASEQNNAGFEIWAAASESVEAEWTKLGFVNGAGTTSSSQSYEWYGQMPETGTYFKLVQRDLDGTSKEVGRVFLNKDKASDIHANIYPNPTNGVVNFTYHALTDAQGHLVVTDAVGRVVKTMDTDLMRGSGAQVIDLSAEPAGVYLINLTVDTEGKKQQWKLLKQ